MKILVVSPYYSTHNGGIEIVAGTLAAMLSHAHAVVWAASDCDQLPVDGIERVRFVPMRCANAIERLTGLPFPFWAPRSIAQLWAETRAADIVHLHDVTYLGNWAAFVCATLCRKPLVITQHVGFIPYRNPILRFALRAVHATAGRLMLGRADQVVFVSGVVRDYFARFVRFEREPLVVPNGVDVEMFEPAPGNDRRGARAAIGLDPERPVLLFVGRFVEKKGLTILEYLARRLTEVSWIFAGWGPLNPDGWGCPHVQVFADRRGASLVPLYQAADLMVLPSVGEGLPLVVQESMSCGTPVMVGEDTAAAVDAAPDLVFACPVEGKGARDAWESSIRRILSDASALADRQIPSALFARSRWSWKACAAAYGAVFHERSRPIASRL
jgi:glycosyltransferase involved in cell wall biosynthesis